MDIFIFSFFINVMDIFIFSLFRNVIDIYVFSFFMNVMDIFIFSLVMNFIDIFNTKLDGINIFNIEITYVCIANKFVFLMGDFNTRTCSKADFVVADEFLTHYFSFDDSLDGSLNISSKIEKKKKISKYRVSQDKIINNDLVLV